MLQTRPQHTNPSRPIVSVAVDSYLLTLEREHFYRGWRYYWMICAERNPDELLSWGYAPTQQLAEMAAGTEMKRLESGLHHGNRVTRSNKSLLRCE